MTDPVEKDKPQEQASEKNQERLRVFREVMEGGSLAAARSALNAMHPAEIALLLESLPPIERAVAWDLVDPSFDGDVLLYVNDELRASFIREMEATELVAATERLDTDDLADILQDLPESVIQQILESMDHQDRLRLEAVLSYPDDTAGGLMNTDTVTVRADVALFVVMRYLRLRGKLPDMTDSLIVVDREDKYLGLLLITDLLLKPPGALVQDVMITDVEPISAQARDTEVAALFERRDLISAPVVDDSGKLVGRITIDDVVDVIRDEADHSIMSRVGLSEEEDIFAPALSSARRRAIWLGFNLLTVLFASWVIGLFEATIERVVALAVLMPIVASMGGIAGSQTLTLVIRGLALGQIGTENANRVLRKEVAVGMMNGLLWAVVIAAIAMLWFKDVELAAVIGSAIVVNLIVGAAFGATIPLLMRKFGSDPALGGSVLLTAVTDAVGFFAFLGLASILLL